MRYALLLFIASISLYAQGWADLPSTHMQAVCPANAGAVTSLPTATISNYAFSDQCHYVMGSWGSAVTDTKRNKLVLWNGGHNDYYGNEVYSFSPFAVTPAWTRLTNPSPWSFTLSCPTGSFCEKNPDGTPVSRHSWQALQYLPATDELISVGGATVPNGTVYNNTWTFSLATNTWTAMDPVNGFDPTSIFHSTYGNLSVFDPNSGDVFAIFDTSFLTRYHRATNTYTLLNSSVSYPGTTAAAVDPVRQAIYMMGGTSFSVQMIDISPGSAYNLVDITSGVTGCSGMAVDYPSLVYDSSISRFVGYPAQGNTVYIFDPGSMTCVAQTLAGPTVPAGSVNGTFGRFAYFPSVNKYVLCNDTGNDCFTFTLSLNGTSGLGSTTATCLDVDGDGYGVGPGCTGPDADDNDSAVHTGAQAVSKYGTLAAFVNHLGYNPSRLWYLSTSGNDGSCAVGTLASPPSTACATWLHIRPSLTAGDMVIMRGGTWAGVTQSFASGGTSGNPIVLMAYPGELPFIDNRATTTAIGIDITSTSWIVIDGIKAAGGLGNSGCIGGGGQNTNVTIRHTETTECTDGGIDAFDGLVDWNIEYNVMHDMATVLCSNCQHNLYMGSRTHPSRNVAIRRNLGFNSNPYPGFQFNGRVTNLQMEQNIEHSTPDATAYSLENGVSNSFFRGNIAFNSKSGLQLINYDGDCYNGTGSSGSSGICPYNQTGNLIENNVLYVGSVDSANTAVNAPGLLVANVSTGCPEAYNPGKNYDPGFQVLYPYGVTGGTKYVALNSGFLSTPPSADWTTGNGCTMAKQNSVGSNTYRNNIFQNDNGGTTAYASVNFPMCTTASQISGGLCVLDTGDTTLSTSTFVDNVFWSTGGGASGAISTGPNPGFGYTPHSCAALTSLTTMSGCINADPQFVAASPSAYWNSPSSFNFRLDGGSPAAGAGTAVGVPVFDIIGTAHSPTAPNIGAYAGGAGCSISPSTAGPYTAGQTSSFATFVATGCSSSTYTISSGSLAGSGLSLNSSTGALTGTAVAGAYTFIVAYASAATPSISLTINAAPVITTSSPLPTGTVGTGYSQTLVASPGGTAPLTWSVSSGSVPTGTSLSSSGVISGTPSTTSGSPFTPTLLVTDANGRTDSKLFSITVNPGAGASVGRSMSSRATVSSTTKH